MNSASAFVKKVALRTLRLAETQRVLRPNNVAQFELLDRQFEKRRGLTDIRLGDVNPAFYTTTIRTAGNALEP